MDEIRINKFISNSGFCSRRIADNLIEQGRVKVNNKIADKGMLVNVNKDDVFVDDKKIQIQNDKIYIMLNKPVGYVTTVKEQFDRPCVTDLIEENIRVYPVGRLDMNTSGLLILTNDGEFTNRITHPKNHVSKVYEVKTKYELLDKDIQILCNGVDIGGYVTKPAKVSRLSNNRITITISEGKNRQVRKMIESVNNKVIELKRVKIGQLSLDNLKEGEYIYLKEKELEKIFK